MSISELIKESFELFCKKRWLKYIDKEVERYNRWNSKTKRQAYVVHELMNRYNELYPNDKVESKEKES